MGLIADSGGIYALYDAGDRHHRAVVSIVRRETGPIVIPAVVLAEIDFLLRTHLGVDAELDFLEGLATGTYMLEPFTASDLRRCRQLVEQYRDADIGLADAAVVAIAERLRMRRILTTDVRDFRLVRPTGAAPFTLLPADAE
jgi:hypothetical protein